MSAAVESMSVFGLMNGDMLPIDVRHLAAFRFSKISVLGNRITSEMCELGSRVSDRILVQ